MGEELSFTWYHVKLGNEAALERLLAKHWPLLKKIRLATDEAPAIFRGHDKQGSCYVEVFGWRDAAAPRSAQHYPEVQTLRTELAALTEARGGHPGVETMTSQRVKLAFASAGTPPSR